MGGAVFSLRGKLSEERQSVIERPPSFFDRLFRRKRLCWQEIVAGRFVVDLPAKDFEQIKDMFVQYLEKALNPAWGSSQRLFEYLDVAMDVRLRGEREGHGDAEWSFELGFSGCAGLGQVSAELAAHWAEIWFRRERPALDAFLESRGFAPVSGQRFVGETNTFLPVGEYGYASFDPEGWEDCETRKVLHFDLDAGAMENMDDGGEALLATLETAFSGTMADGRCRCQFCDPSAASAMSAFLEKLPSVTPST